MHDREATCRRLRALPEGTLRSFNYVVHVHARAQVPGLVFPGASTEYEQLRDDLAVIDALEAGARELATTCWFAAAWSVLGVLDVQRSGKRAPGDGLERQVRAHLPTFDPIRWMDGCRAQLRRVCRVEAAGARGTGFLVAPDLVLTCHHVVAQVIAERGSGVQIRCLFDHWAVGDSVVEPGTRFRARDAWPEWHVDSTPPIADEALGDPEPTRDQLDFALIRLAHPVGDDVVDGRRRGWIRLTETEPELAPGAALSIVQHPNGAPIKLAFDTSAIQHVNRGKTRVRYATNTARGASGSPCFDVHWNLVAMHHYGDRDHVPARYNQGIPSHAIHDRLRREGLAAQLGGQC